SKVNRRNRRSPLTTFVSSLTKKLNQIDANSTSFIKTNTNKQNIKSLTYTSPLNNSYDNDNINNNKSNIVLFDKKQPLLEDTHNLNDKINDNNDNENENEN